MGMVLPNYKDGSILNLMSSIGKNFGWNSKYKPLKLLPPEELKDSKNVVLMVIDGLGYEYLMKSGKGSIFNQYLKGKMTSVFPSSTTSAIPAFMTGDACVKHGMTGWNVFLKEFGSIAIPLPYVLKIDKTFSLGQKKDIKEIFDIEPFTNKIKVNSYNVVFNVIAKSDFTKAASGKMKMKEYKDTKDYFKKIERVIKSNKKKKYIYAYYPEHDHYSHEEGVGSKRVLNHFKKLNKELKLFLKSIEGTSTTLIITADHGEIDSPNSKVVNLEKHPKLNALLSNKLCGESRFVYCYVKSGKGKEFEKYVKTKLKHACELYKNEDLVKKDFFGLYGQHEKLLDRIGDYVLIMKDNYVFYDKLNYKGKKLERNIGDHGGLSKEEMLVPLIVIKR
jgi:predicted AlkP superfamily pyrophosphatase or phosphodiesterase